MKPFFRDFNRYVRNKRKFVLAVLLNVIVSLMHIGSALLYGELINRVSVGNTFGEMVPMIVFTSVYTLIQAFVMWFSQYYEPKLIAESTFEMNNAYVTRLLSTKYALVTKEDSSRYINNLTRDVRSVVEVYIGDIAWFVSSVVSVATSFVAAVTLNWKIALSMLVFVAVMAILPLFIKKPLDKSIVEVSNRNRDYIRSLKENLLGVSVIKNNCAEDVCCAEITESNARFLKAQRRNIFINSFASGLGGMVRNIAVMALIVITCYFVYTKEVLVGAVLSIYSIGMTFYGSLLSCSAVITYLTSLTGVRNIVNEILDYPEIAEGCAPEFTQAIRLEKVGFEYPGTERAILRDIDMTLEKNKKYLIIGKSGSGKSTILKLLCGFYDTYSGSIALDGTDYRQFNEKRINKLIAYCPQNGYLFNRTLRYNIDFRKDNDDEKLRRVIDTVELRDFTEKLQGGLDSVIDEEVNQISGGEKLRVNLARSLYRESGVLLLDEVTSALDKKTSEIVERNMLSIGDKTLVNVCHKFNDETLPLYDRIFVIEDGIIALEGSFNEIENNPVLNKYRNVEEAGAARTGEVS